MGDATSDTCGVNPCGWMDFLTVPSQNCAKYVVCGAEQSILTMPTGGVFTPNQVAYGGGVVAQAAAEKAGELGMDALKNFAAGTGAGETDSVTNGIVTTLIIAGVVLAGIMIVPALVRR